MAATLVTACVRKPKPVPPAPPAKPALTESTLPESGLPSFEIGRITDRTSDDHRDLFVEGTVRNTGTRASRDVKVWVEALDAGNQRVAEGEALPTPQEIPPGTAASFVVKLPNTPGIKTFHVEAIGR